MFFGEAFADCTTFVEGEAVGESDGGDFAPWVADFVGFGLGGRVLVSMRIEF